MDDSMAIDVQENKLNQARSSSRRGRRRKVPDNVSPNACTNCKKARARCEGHEPSACRRCLDRDMAHSCHYEVHVKTKKDEMIRKIKDLEQQKTSFTNAARQKNEYVKFIFETLRTRLGPEIIDHLRAAEAQYQHETETDNLPPLGEGYRSRSEEVELSSPESLRSYSPTLEQRRLPDVVARIEQAMNVRQVADGGMPPRPATGTAPQWISTSTRELLSSQMLELYFRWVHPVHALFSERHFRGALRAGNETLACPALTSAVCAMGAFYFSVPGIESRDVLLLVERFLEEAREEVLRVPRDSPQFATVYALLFLAELGLGHGRKAAPYLRVAAEALPNISRLGVDPDAVEAIAAGIVNLEVMWSNFTYKMPSLPLLRSNEYSVSRDIPGPSECRWQAQRSYFDSPVIGQQPQLECATGADADIARHLVELNYIVLDTLNIYGSTSAVSAALVFSVYRRYRQWHDGLPWAVKVEDNSPKSAHVLFLHIYYHVAICQLLYPVTVHCSPSSVARSRIHDFWLRSVQRGLQLLERFQNPTQEASSPSAFPQPSSTRPVTPFHLFCTLYLCESAARNMCHRPYGASNVTPFCYKALRDATTAFPLAETLLACLAREWGSPGEGGEAQPPTSSWHEDMLEATGRLTLAQPAHAITAHFDGARLGEDLERLLPEFKRADAGAPTPGNGGSRPSTATGSSPGSTSSTVHRGPITVTSLINP